MKITKRQLRKIIKEEKARILAECRIRRIIRKRLIQEMGPVMEGEEEEEELEEMDSAMEDVEEDEEEDVEETYQY